jgi:hypothetical protein
MAIAMKWIFAVVFVVAAIGLMVLIATAQDITGGLNNPTNAIIGGVGSGGGFNNSTGTIVGGGGGPTTVDCIEYDTGSCILYNTSASNSITWH